MSEYLLDRGRSPAASRRKSGRGRDIATWVILGVAAVILAVCLWKYYNPPEPPPKEKLPDVLGSVIDQRYQAPVLPVAPQPKPDTAPPQTSGLPDNWDQPPAAQKPWSGNPQGQQATDLPKPNFSFFAVPKKATPEAAADPHTGAPGATEASANSDVVYASPKMAGAQAGRMGDPTLRLDRGLLPCILDWDVDSTFGGPIQCHVPMDIRPHGVTLLDRGTIISGEYAGNVRTGQKRLDSRVDTIEDRATNCFVIPGDMPVTEANGMAGVSGSVDNHYGERFVAAAAFAATQMASQIAQSIISAQSQNGNRGNNSYYNFGGGGYGNNGIDQLAQTILQSQINIPPTVTLNRGDTIAVVIKKPIDFHRCYGLTIRKN